MAGWTKQKRNTTEAAFYVYLDRCYVNSRDGGRICLGKAIYDGQRRVITSIFDGLEEDIHWFVILKSRQLGISTIIRALIIFLLGLHKGLKGAIVFDTDNNKVESRAELEVMIEELPKSLKFPSIKSSNRAGLSLTNNSKVLFMSAGVKKSKSSGTLGRSVGLSVVHGSELCSWDNDEGWEAFRASLSDVNPDRIYIWESTARGPDNLWYDIVQEAKKDSWHQKFIFIGWWSKDSQRIEKTDRDFEIYGKVPPSDKEQEKIEAVRELYGVQVTPEQLAWVRRNSDPTAQADGDVDPDFEPSNLRLQEQPWTEEDAFQQTGSIFFPAETLTKFTRKYASNKFNAWMFLPGGEFVDMRVIKAPNVRNIDLKVWEEPDPHGVYCIGIDPAFGQNEYNDRSCIQVCRCYADGIDQVAEYVSPLVTTQQLAWVIAAILGWYGESEHSYVKYALELTGPGYAVFNELKTLRLHLQSGYQQREVVEKGLQNVFRNVRTYIYARPDSMGQGHNYHIKTTRDLKVLFMERMRDFVSNEMLRVRSFELLDEMKGVAREGDSIQGRHDDRVLAMAFAIHDWETNIRRQLMIQHRTRDAEAARKMVSIKDQVSLFQQNQLQSFFEQKRRGRMQEQRIALRQTWRYR